MWATIKAIFLKGLDIKDPKIAFMYFFTICFVVHCVFFGGAKFIKDSIYPADTKSDQIEAAKVDTIKVD